MNNNIHAALPTNKKVHTAIKSGNEPGMRL
jgi:hypothetical protein